MKIHIWIIVPFLLLWILAFAWIQTHCDNSADQYESAATSEILPLQTYTDTNMEREQNEQ